MTLNEAIHRLCQQVRSDIQDMEHTAKMVVNQDTKSALAEDIGRLREALDAVAESGLERPDPKAYESFFETVRDRL